MLPEKETYRGQTYLVWDTRRDTFAPRPGFAPRPELAGAPAGRYLVDPATGDVRWLVDPGIMGRLAENDEGVKVKRDFDAPKTQALLAKLKTLDLADVLIVTEDVDRNLYLSARNLRTVDVCDVAALDLRWFEDRPLLGRCIVVTRARAQAGALRDRLTALGADVVSIGTAALVAIGDNDPRWEEEYQKLGTTAGAYDDWHEGKDPAGITTQDPELAARLDPVAAGRRLANYLKVMTLEAQTIARACGKNKLTNLEPEDLCALTMEAAAMAQVPLAGTSWYPGKGGF